LESALETVGTDSTMDEEAMAWLRRWRRCGTSWRGTRINITGSTRGKALLAEFLPNLQRRLPDYLTHQLGSKLLLLRFFYSEAISKRKMKFLVITGNFFDYSSKRN
jgi:hypothetical protein